MCPGVVGDGRRGVGRAQRGGRGGAGAEAPGSAVRRLWFWGAGVSVARDGDGPSEVTGMIVYTRVADSGRAATPPKKIGRFESAAGDFLRGGEPVIPIFL